MPKLTKEEKKEKERQRAIKRAEKRKKLIELFETMGEVEFKIEPKKTLTIKSDRIIQAKL